MERLSAFWNLAPLWVALAALIVAAFAIAHVRRLRAAQRAQRNPPPQPSTECELEAVDSSHVGFAPLVSDAPHRLRLDADGPTQGEDSPDGRS